MGHVTSTGNGWGCKPNGYYLSLSADGTCSLYVSKQDEKNNEMGTLLATGKASGISAAHWHTLMLRFSGNTITGFVNNNLILSASDSIFAEGMAGLVSGSKDKTSNIALFDNLMIKPVKGIKPTPAVFSEEIKPVYAPAVKNDY